MVRQVHRPRGRWASPAQCSSQATRHRSSATTLGLAACAMPRRSASVETALLPVVAPLLAVHEREIEALPGCQPGGALVNRELIAPGLGCAPLAVVQTRWRAASPARSARRAAAGPPRPLARPGRAAQLFWCRRFCLGLIRPSFGLYWTPGMCRALAGWWR